MSARPFLKRNKEIFFTCLLAFLTLAAVLMILECFAFFMVYRAGSFLAEVDKEYYARLVTAEPGYLVDERGYPYVFDKTCGWIHRPGYKGCSRGGEYPRGEFYVPFEINSAGFRSSREDVPDPSCFRIAILGDSFVQALQVREDATFPKIIESHFNRKGRKTFVYNLGVSSLGTAHQYRILQEKVWPIRPHLVVLAFFHNDYTDNSPFYYHETEFLYPRYTVQPDGQIHVEDFGPQNAPQKIVGYRWPNVHPVVEPRWLPVFRFVAFLREKIPGSLFLRYAEAILTEKTVAKTEYDPPFDAFRKKYPPPLKKSVTITFQLIRQMNHECEKRGSRFMVVMIPSREQVAPHLWQGYLRQRSRILAPSDFDLEKPYRLLAGFLRAEGIAYLDLSEIFRQAPNPEALYYKHDRHFNRKGHRKAGQALAAFIESQGEGIFKPDLSF